MQMGLSDPVRAAVDEAATLVASLAVRLANGDCVEAGEDDWISEKETRICRDR